MSTKLVNIDRRTPMLLPCDMREWVPEDDLVHFVLAVIEKLNISKLTVNERGTGSAQYPPGMMLSLLIYCYANGIFGSRRIERATYRDIAVRYITADTHPDHDTIATFRRKNLDVLSECFVKVLEYAREIGVLKVGKVSIDGTHMRASASRDKNVTYQRAGELKEQLELEVKGLLEKAEQSDRQQQDDGQQLPAELKRREALARKLEKAREQLEKRARQRAQAEAAEYEKRVKDKGGKPNKNKKKPDDKPREKEQQNLVDPDSRLMCKNKRSSFEQSYNAQAVVDAEGSQLVLGARVSQNENDYKELAADIESIPAQIGKPEAVLADSGYASEQQLEDLEQYGIEGYISTGAESQQQRRKHDLRPEEKQKKAPVKFKKPLLKAMKEKLESKAAQRIYRLRKQTVEPVFGVIKQAMGFRQFHLRGKPKVSGEWKLITLAYNFKRLHNILGNDPLAWKI